MSKVKSLVCAAILILTSVAQAAPSISSVSGTITDGQSITISGSGFGSKSTAAPTLWDDCSGTDPLDLWTCGSPMTCHEADENNATYNINYRTPAAVGRGVALPHSHITKYLCGAHYYSVGDGANVVIWKTVEVSPPCYTYVSWYRRIDPNWVWGDYDQNFKDACWCDTLTEGPYSCNNYLSHHDGNLYQYYTGYWDANVFSGYEVALEHERLETKWVKTEWETYWSNSSGWMKVWEDGVLKMHYAGDTLTDGGPNLIAIEGFFREISTENWRYMADIYIDHSIQRVLIGNASTLASCTTLREIQIPTAWSSTSITTTVNQGGFANGATAYLYVFDASGVANSTGKEITFGSSGGGEASVTAAGAAFSGGGTVR